MEEGTDTNHPPIKEGIVPPIREGVSRQHHRKEFFRWRKRGKSECAAVFLILVIREFATVEGLNCYECGSMYDGTNFMGIQGFKQCQFLESAVATARLKTSPDDFSSSPSSSSSPSEFMKRCPEGDNCCFTLREYMDIDFWGHSAAAEVSLHGCCSSLNSSAFQFHHLPNSKPPELVTSGRFRADIMSKTFEVGHIKSRVMFCNSLGCNSHRIPWSTPEKVQEQDEQEEEVDYFQDEDDEYEGGAGFRVPRKNERLTSDVGSSEFILPSSTSEILLPTEEEQELIARMIKRRRRPTQEPRQQEQEELPSTASRRTFDLDTEPPDDLNVIDLIELGRSKEMKAQQAKNEDNMNNNSREYIDITASVEDEVDSVEEERSSGNNESRPVLDANLIPELEKQAQEQDEQQITSPRLLATSPKQQLPSILSSSHFKSPVCECHCNCPALVCPEKNNDNTNNFNDRILRETETFRGGRLSNLQPVVLNVATSGAGLKTRTCVGSLIVILVMCYKSVA